MNNPPLLLRVVLRTGALLLSILGPSTASAELTETPVDISMGFGTDNGDFVQLQLEAEPRFDFSVAERGSVVASLRLRLDARDELEPGDPDFDNYAALSKPLTLGDAGTVELRDVYYEQLFDAGLVRLGKQQIVWGRLDGVKILDVVNPQTFREFILDDLEDSRIGLWSAYADFSFSGWRAELAWIPDLTSHDIPQPGAWFELQAPRFRFGAPVDSPGLPSTTDRDGDWFNDAAIGARLSRFFGGVDVSALYYSGRDHEPLGRLVIDAEGPVIEQFHRSRDVLGLSAESSWGPIAWRAELAHQPDRQFNSREVDGLTTVALDQTTLGIGADIQLPANVLANVQLIWDRVENAPSTLVRPDEDQLLTLFLRRGFAYETVRAEFRWYHSLTDHDDTLVATVRYEMSDDVSAYISAEWFQGDREGLFGQFATQDRVYFGFERYF